MSLLSSSRTVDVSKRATLLFSLPSSRTPSPPWELDELRLPREQLQPNPSRCLSSFGHQEKNRKEVLAESRFTSLKINVAAKSNSLAKCAAGTDPLASSKTSGLLVGPSGPKCQALCRFGVCVWEREERRRGEEEEEGERREGRGKGERGRVGGEGGCWWCGRMTYDICLSICHRSATTA